MWFLCLKVAKIFTSCEIEIDKLWKQSQTREKYIFVCLRMHQNKVDWPCQQRSLLRACIASETLGNSDVLPVVTTCEYCVNLWMSLVTTCETQRNKLWKHLHHSHFHKVSDATQALDKTLCWHGQSTLFLRIPLPTKMYFSWVCDCFHKLSISISQLVSILATSRRKKDTEKSTFSKNFNGGVVVHAYI